MEARQDIAERNAKICEMNAKGHDIAVIAFEVGATPNAVRMVLYRNTKAWERELSTRNGNLALKVSPDILKRLRHQADLRGISHRDLACQIVHAVIQRGLVRQVLDGAKT